MGYTTYVQRFLDYCTHQKDLDAKTIKAYRIDLRQFLTELERSGGEITKDSILAYISYLNERFKPRSVKRKIASVKVFCSYLQDEGMLPDNPFLRLRLKLPQIQTLPRVIPLRVIDAMLCQAHKEVRMAKSKTARWAALRETAVMEMLFATIFDNECNS